MSAPPHSLLGRGRSGLGLAVGVSLAAHVGVIALALVASQARARPLLDPDAKPIVAKLVRLGTPRDANLLPRKYKTPPPPKPTAPAPVKPPEPKAEPPKPSAPAPALPKPAPARAEPTPPAPATPERNEDPLAAAIGRISDGYDPNADPDELPPGALDGDPRGDAAVASEGDRYLALVKRAVQDRYDVPDIISDRERLHLNATVVIFVAPDGRILRKEIERPSTNSHFDAALLRAIEAANPLPPPPASWRERFGRDGIGFNFRL